MDVLWPKEHQATAEGSLREGVLDAVTAKQGTWCVPARRGAMEEAGWPGSALRLRHAPRLLHGQTRGLDGPALCSSSASCQILRCWWKEWTRQKEQCA